MAKDKKDSNNSAPTDAAEPAAPPTEAAPAPVLTDAEKKAAEAAQKRADAEAKEKAEIEAAARERAAQINAEAAAGNPFVDPVPESGEEDTGPGIARKITPKDVLEGNIREMVMKGKLKLYAEDGSALKVPLFSVIGRASNIREGESNFGPWTSLVGEFEAQRASDGKEFASTECIVPGPAGELLVKAVRAFITAPIEVTPEEFKLKGRTFKVTGEAVELGLMVSAVPNSRAGGAPYEFVVDPIIKLQRSDTLTKLRERANKFLLIAKKTHQASLPAPAQAALPSA